MLQDGSPLSLHRDTNTLIPLKQFRRIDKPQVSVLCLSPDYLWRKVSRWVSCYAIFQGLLLLSKPPHCQWNSTTLSALSIDLGTLNWDLGCFPFVQWSLAPTDWLPRYNLEYSEFDRTCEISPCQVLPVLYPSREHATLTQKLFRREPAITKLD